MSGFAQYPGSEVRARLDHPVIDADAHVLECEFAINDFLAQVGGASMVEKSRSRMRASPYKFNTRTIWWGTPSGKHTGDRAMAMLPRLFKARMADAGIDYAHCYTTNGIPGLYIQDDELVEVTPKSIRLRKKHLERGAVGAAAGGEDEGALEIRDRFFARRARRDRRAERRCEELEAGRRGNGGGGRGLDERREAGSAVAEGDD